MCADDTKQRIHQSSITTMNKTRSAIKGLNRYSKVLCKLNNIIDGSISVNYQHIHSPDDIVTSFPKSSSKISHIHHNIICKDIVTTKCELISPSEPILLICSDDSPLVASSAHQVNQILMQKFVSSDTDHNKFCACQSVK